MSMSVERIGVLVKVAESRADEAAEQLALRRVGLTEEEGRLQELRRYLDEYRARPIPPSPMLIANRERFLARLGEAELHQTRAVNAAAQAVKESTQTWLEKRVGQQKFGVLQAAAVGREGRASEQSSQKMLDEFALRRFTLGPDTRSD